VLASLSLREAMNQADIFRFILLQNGPSSHILQSRICDGSLAGAPFPGRFFHGISLIHLKIKKNITLHTISLFCFLCKLLVF
jgi:hypothetical protein